MVPATWQYYGAEHAHLPASQRPEIPEPGNQVAVLPGARNQKLTVELGDQLPEEGTLRVRVRAARTDVARPHLPSIQLEFGWQASNEGRALLRVSQQDQQISASPEDPQFYQWDIPLGEIYPRNSVRGVSKMGHMPSPSEYIRLVNSSVTKEDIQIDYVEVMAPVYEQWPPACHLRVFPESELRDDENAYARFVLTTFMERAWRRPILEREVDRKLKLLKTVRPQCDNLEDAMIEVLATVLSAPDFLYVNWPGSLAPEEMDLEVVENCELATQLASFLWCSIPDQTLLDLAKEKQLMEPEILAGQVQRMLADSKADRLSEEFVNQWLELELLDFLKWKKGDNPFLKEAMMEEPVEYFQEVLRRNDSVLAFIHSDYAVVNERLARHYGLKDVRGNDFRVVEVPAGDLRRGGLLTQAGVLAMNSDGEQSHPLKRGVWLLENILNDPPPPPPPAVPQIDLANPEIAKMTLKERIEDHRNHAACMACHAKIDPWGIAFENYDEKGKWRDQIQGRPVDASSQLWNQQQLDGVSGLKHYLLDSKQDQFVRAMVAKLSMFALGRPLTFADHAAVDQIASDVRHEGDGLRTLIQKLIASELFLNN